MTKVRSCALCPPNITTKNCRKFKKKKNPETQT